MSDEDVKPPTTETTPAATAETKDVKEANHINIKVVGQDQNEICFKIKRSTKLEKLMNAYCERQGVSKLNVRFLFDGERVLPNQTPDELDLQDWDSIQVLAQQTGGQYKLML